MSRSINVADVSLELEERGEGPPLLFLHAGAGLQPQREWLDLLAQRFRVIAPYHPGWGDSALPDWLSTVDDLAYLYLDLATTFGLEQAILVGACFGGWIAAEMAIRNTRRFTKLALVDPLGIKVGGILDRDIADMHAMTRDEYIRLTWADPAKGLSDLTQLSERELAYIARGREAFTRFGWKPMHNPHLKRWLHRIDIPTLCCGARKTASSARRTAGVARRDPETRGWTSSPMPATSRTQNNVASPPAHAFPTQLRARRALLVFLRDGVSPRVGSGPRARHAACGAAVEQLRSAHRARAAEPLSRRVRAVR
jgi:pimeloyl-ACP methyl ester carboxylesterase